MTESGQRSNVPARPAPTRWSSRLPAIAPRPLECRTPPVRSGDDEETFCTLPRCSTRLRQRLGPEPSVEDKPATVERGFGWICKLQSGLRARGHLHKHPDSRTLTLGKSLGRMLSRSADTLVW